MRIVVPYTVEHSEVRDALPTRTRFVKMQDDHHYYGLFISEWQHQSDFLLVEHDIVVTARAFDRFVICPHRWCVSPYQMGDHLSWSLGCARFRAPRPIGSDSWTSAVERFEQSTHMDGRRWCNLDRVVHSELARLGWEPCVHEDSPVQHLHDYSGADYVEPDPPTAIRGQL